MAVHLTIYPDDRVAAALRRFMAAHDCSATTAVQLLLDRELARQAPAVAPSRSYYLDVRTWADLTCAPDGRVCTVPERH